MRYRSRDTSVSIYVCRLTSKHGYEVINFRTDEGINLLCDAILNCHFDCAEILLEFERKHKLFVMINTGECVTLDHGRAQDSVVVAKFVLDRVAAKQFTVDESCNILTNYLLPLTQTFPDVMLDYLKRDAFSFEYGKVQVPATLFDNAEGLVGMTTDEKLTDWTSLGSAAVKEFWSKNCGEHLTAFDETSGVQVEAVAKFLCVNQHSIRRSWFDDTVGLNERRDRSRLLGFPLNRRGIPMRVVNSEALQAIANWVFGSFRGRFGLFIILEVLAGVLFFGIAWSPKALQDEEDPSHSARMFAASYLFSFATFRIYELEIRRLWI